MITGQIKFKTPLKAVNKAYLKLPVAQSEINRFKENYARMLLAEQPSHATPTLPKYSIVSNCLNRMELACRKYSVCITDDLWISSFFHPNHWSQI